MRGRFRFVSLFNDIPTVVVNLIPKYPWRRTNREITVRTHQLRGCNSALYPLRYRDSTLRKKNWWDLYKRIVWCFDQILGAAPHIKVVLRQQTSHFTNYSKKTKNITGTLRRMIELINAVSLWILINVYSNVWWAAKSCTYQLCEHTNDVRESNISVWSTRFDDDDNDICKFVFDCIVSVFHCLVKDKVK